jgi:glucoamylase
LPHGAHKPYNVSTNGMPATCKLRRTMGAVSLHVILRRAASALVAGVLCLDTTGASASPAPGAPGSPPTWAYAGKVGIGASYEAYDDDLKFSNAAPTGVVSRVWFSLANGEVTETMYGLIHQAQLKDMQLVIKSGHRIETEADDAVHSVAYIDRDAQGRPLSLAYRLTNRAKSGRWLVIKDVFTDPDGQALFTRVTVRALKGTVVPFIIVNPHVENSGAGNRADADADMLHAWKGETHLVVRFSRRPRATSVGFAGASDGLAELRRHGRLRIYDSTGAQSGNVSMTAGLAPLRQGRSATYDVVLGFGGTRDAARDQADAALRRGYRQVLDKYNGSRGHIGWETYLASLPELKRLALVSEDGGKLLYASAMVLKAQEDKTYAGALIASLSNPWGDSTSADAPATGYKAVWPRDFYHVASALLALGDRRTPAAALAYLRTVQVGPATPGNRGAGGWFLQKTHVDGVPEWVGVQLDQTAMPILLTDKLEREGVVSHAQSESLYASMIKPAADFLVGGGKVDLDWNKATITPPRTQQERWEEQAGYSPSTTAAVVAGLTAAAGLAERAGDASSASKDLAAADEVASRIEHLMFTTEGALASGGRGRYFLRLAPDGDPNDHSLLESRNGQPALPQDDYLDAGFLELVRYGVRSPADAAIRSSLPVIDDMRLDERLRVKYEFRFPGQPGSYPGWRRYGDDGYGEDASTGAGYNAGGRNTPGQRGRVWPLLTGERGHYELAYAMARPGGATDADITRLRSTYVRAMELFANSGLMLPEQVWDGVGERGPHQIQPGQGAGSATPLAWAHAEYVRLLRSIADGRVWDLSPETAARYGARQ